MANDPAKQQLEKAVTAAMLDLFAYTATSALKLSIKGTHAYRAWVASHPPIV